MGDPRVEVGRRWNVLWVHYEAEALRVHYRAMIPSETARAVSLACSPRGASPPDAGRAADHFQMSSHSRA